MNGIEKITAKILDDARAEAEEIKRASQAECAEIAERYRAEAEAEAARIIADGKTEAERRAERVAGTARTDAKKALLAEKQLIITEAFNLAAKKLEDVNDSGKFDIQIVKPDGSTESKRDIAMTLERRRNELTPKVADILFEE